MTSRRDSFDRWPGLDALFAQALETPTAERVAFLDSACRTDPELRREVERLLAAHDAAESFLEDPAVWLGELPPAPAPPGAEDSRERMAPWLGRTIGRYEVLEPIGAGGMGVLVKARDTELDRLVTLKFLQPHLGTHPTALQRFLQEAQAASALDHPNICTIYGFEEADDGQRCIAMAYYAGETLKDRLARGLVPVAEALDIVRQIGEGLARAHEAGIVHRDLKPANVMLTERGEVKILDFGIAKLAGSDEITQTGARLGTAAYMSPEQARGERVDHRTDVWALGVVLHELVTGKRPFRGEHEQAVIHNIIHVEPGMGDVPPELAGIVRTALAKDPDARYPDVPAMLSAVRAAERGAAPPPTGTPASRPRRWRWPVIAGVAAVVAAAAIGVWRLGGTDPVDPATSLPRLVVLPFENLGPPEDEYFADGITDETVARLAKVGGLAVLARQSAMRYKGSEKTPAEIGDELGVDYILEATISWEHSRDGTDRVRVRPQLIRVTDGTHVWAEVYEDDLTEVFRLQSDMAQRIVAALGIALLDPEQRALVARPTDDLQAYDHFLRGNHYLLARDRGATVRAIDEYRAAVAIDPKFADAQARIAYAFGLFADHGWIHPTLSSDSMLALGFAAVDHALELNPRSADAWMARAYLLAFRNADTYAGVADAFEQAITYDPNDAEAHLQYASMIGRLGVTPRVEQLFHRALVLEPRHAIAIMNLAFFYLIERRYDDAVRFADSAVAVNPTLYHGYEHRAQIRSTVGQHVAARADAEAAIAGTDGALGIAVLALVTARAHDTVTGRWAAARALAGDRPVHNEGRMWLIGALLAMGDTVRALDLLERARDRLGLVYLRHLLRQPEFDPVRDDPRFQAIRPNARDTVPSG